MCLSPENPTLSGLLIIVSLYKYLECSKHVGIWGVKVDDLCLRILGYMCRWTRWISTDRAFGANVWTEVSRQAMYQRGFRVCFKWSTRLCIITGLHNPHGSFLGFGCLPGRPKNQQHHPVIVPNRT